MQNQFRVFLGLFFVYCYMCNTSSLAAEVQNPTPLNMTDVMQFENFSDQSFSDDGSWIAYSVSPNRGDPRGIIQSSDGKHQIEIARATKPQFNAASTHVAFIIDLPWSEKQKKQKKQQKEALKAKKDFELVVVNLNNKQQTRYSAVKSFEFSQSNEFLAVHFGAGEGDEKSTSMEDFGVSAESDEQKFDKPENSNTKSLGSSLLLLNLTNGEKTEMSAVSEYAFYPGDALFAYSIQDEAGQTNGVKLLNLKDGSRQYIFKRERSQVAQLTWHEHSLSLAFYVGDSEVKIKQRDYQLWVWRGETNKLQQVKLQSNKAQPDELVINQYSEIQWNEHDESFTFGAVVADKPAVLQLDSTKTEQALYDTQSILEQATLQLWHYQDLQIKSEAQASYKDRKKQQILFEYHLANKKIVQLAAENEFDLIQKDNRHGMILLDEKPYQLAQSWQGTYFDAYYLNRKTAKRLLIDRYLRFRSAIKISPDGRYISYFKDKHIWFFDTLSKKRYNLSEQVSVAFYDKDDDRPGPDNAHGIAGWMENSRQFLVYDKFDIWMWDVVSKKSINLTEKIGRAAGRQLRIIDMHEKPTAIAANTDYWLSSFNLQTKQYGFFSFRLKQTSNKKLASSEIKKLVEGEHRYRWIGKSENSEALFYSRENFSEFPNLWKTDFNFSQSTQMSKINSDITRFAWGSPELVDWLNADGVEHQGILIKPANYQSGKSYPTLVYFYETYSDRLFQFNAMKISHRPNLAYYASNGYAIFLPDIHFEIGTPGDSAVKALVPGVQKLIAMGVTDAKAVGIHGHSWGGYQTAFAITQTDLFAAAVAGAPVANMTSAYSGLRLGSGKSRQFQYEAGQSRIAHSMWQRRDLYIENSPVFFADRINTPLLIEFGDEDDAVPWEQGIELYLAMRRLNKPAVLLQYEGEPHHLKKFANQLDYTLKVQAFFDHYLKQQAAPEWLMSGVAYRAKD